MKGTSNYQNGTKMDRNELIKGGKTWKGENAIKI